LRADLKVFGTKATVNGVQRLFGGADLELSACGSLHIEACVVDVEYKLCAAELTLRSARLVISDTLDPVLEDGSFPESSCTDGIDNDGDGKIDCADSDCEPKLKLLNGIFYCPNGCDCPEACADGIDNDRDGKTDCADPDCAGHGCFEK